MPEAAKDLDYYQQHPEEFDQLDEEQQLKLLEQGETDPAATEQDDTPEGEGAASGAEGQPGKGTEGTEGDGEEKEAPVATADGQHTIPYEVLKRTREKARTEEEARQAAEREAEEHRKEAERLRQEMQGAREAAERGEGDPGHLEDLEKQIQNLDQASQELIRDYGEDDPLAKMLTTSQQVVKALSAHNRKLQDQVGQVTHERETATREEAASAAQQAIDAIPELAKWQAEGGEQWQKALELDEGMKQDPYWANQPMEERFKEVVRRAGGDPAVKPAGDGGGGGQGPDTDPEAVKEAAEKKVQEETGAGPDTLSDLGGGETPESPEGELDQLDMTELHNKFASMSPQQIEDYLEGKLA